MVQLFPMSSQTEADLQTLIEPLASYISATNRPKTALLLAFILLVSNLQEIGDAANDYLHTLSENNIG